MDASRAFLAHAAGWALVAVGLVMIPLPGPGLPVIAAGLTLLSRRSPWAQRMLEKVKQKLQAGTKEAL